MKNCHKSETSFFKKSSTKLIKRFYPIKNTFFSNISLNCWLNFNFCFSFLVCQFFFSTKIPFFLTELWWKVDCKFRVNTLLLKPSCVFILGRSRHLCNAFSVSNLWVLLIRSTTSDWNSGLLSSVPLYCNSCPTGLFSLRCSSILVLSL